MDDWFYVENSCQRFWFRLSEIASIETPNRPKKPAGWADGFEAFVMLKNRTDGLSLTEEQWDQLQRKLFPSAEA